MSEIRVEYSIIHKQLAEKKNYHLTMRSEGNYFMFDEDLFFKCLRLKPEIGEDVWHWDVVDVAITSPIAEGAKVIMHFPGAISSLRVKGLVGDKSYFSIGKGVDYNAKCDLSFEGQIGTSVTIKSFCSGRVTFTSSKQFLEVEAQHVKFLGSMIAEHTFISHWAYPWVFQHFASARRSSTSCHFY